MYSFVLWTHLLVYLTYESPNSFKLNLLNPFNSSWLSTNKIFHIILYFYNNLFLKKNHKVLMQIYKRRNGLEYEFVLCTFLLYILSIGPLNLLKHDIWNLSNHWPNLCGINIVELKKCVTTFAFKCVIILKYNFFFYKNLFLHLPSPTLPHPHSPHTNFSSSPTLFPLLTRKFLLFFKNKSHTTSFLLQNHPPHTHIFLFFFFNPLSSLQKSPPTHTVINFFFFQPSLF